MLALKDIHFKTIIYCPVHEVDAFHNPSAWVTVSDSGTRRIFCCVCSSDGQGVMEDIPSKVEDIESIAGDNLTRLDVDYLSIDILNLSPDIIPKQPFTVIIKSGMGSGKTTLVKSLLRSNQGASTLKRLMPDRPQIQNGCLDLNLSILAISPRTMLTAYTAKQYKLESQYEAIERFKNEGSINYEDISSRLESVDRLGMCIASIPRLANRHYDVVVMDEARMSAELLLARIGIPVESVTHNLDFHLSKARVRFIMSAGK